MNNYWRNYSSITHTDYGIFTCTLLHLIFLLILFIYFNRRLCCRTYGFVISISHIRIVTMPIPYYRDCIAITSYSNVAYHVLSHILDWHIHRPWVTWISTAVIWQVARYIVTESNHRFGAHQLYRSIHPVRVTYMAPLIGRDQTCHVLGVSETICTNSHSWHNEEFWILRRAQSPRAIPYVTTMIAWGNRVSTPLSSPRLMMMMRGDVRYDERSWWWWLWCHVTCDCKCHVTGQQIFGENVCVQKVPMLISSWRSPPPISAYGRTYIFIFCGELVGPTPTLSVQASTNRCRIRLHHFFY